MDSLQPLWLRFVTTLSTDLLTAPPPALTLTPLPLTQTGGGAVTHVNTAHFHKQPAPPRPAQPAPTPPSLPHCSNIGNTGTRTQDIVPWGHLSSVSSAASLCSSCTFHLSLHCVVHCEMCLPAGVRVCSSHCWCWCWCWCWCSLCCRGRALVTSCRGDGWSSTASQPAQPAPLPTCLLPAAWPHGAVPPRAIQRSVRCTPYTTMQ